MKLILSIDGLMYIDYIGTQRHFQNIYIHFMLLPT